MGGKSRNPLIKEAFQACQSSFSIHPKLVKKLKEFYSSTDPDRFFEDFIFFMKLPLSGVTERSAFIDRTLEFVAKFACSFLEKEAKSSEDDPEETTKEDEGSDEEEELPLFLYRIFAWLLDHHEVEGADARLRVCQLLNKILKYMGEEACIDDDLYNKIYDGMLERLKDKVAEIRAQAVTALQRLQDPKDEECPIIRAYLFHLAHDPNNIVRRTIVRCIGATRLTLPHILERTRDIDEHVRRAAYKFLAEKVHIKSLTINQREGVLKRGLGDRNENVKKVVEKEMIPAWLRLSNNNIVQLLHHLDVGNSDQDNKPGPGSKSAQAGALFVLFQDTPFKELISSFQYLDNEKLIPFDKLTAETAMYWRVLAEFLAEQTAPGAEEYLEMILPELSPFCQYVRKYILELEKNDEDGNWEFVAKELIRMTLIYDLGDEVGRQNLRKLIKDLLISSKSPVAFVSSLVEVFNKVEKNPQTRIDQVAEIISDLKDPLDAEEASSGSDVFHSAPETPTVTSPETRENEELIRSKQLQIAKLRVNMNLMKDQLDEAVNNQNFLSAQEIKSKMDQLEEEQIVLENQLSAAKAAGMAPANKTTTPVENPAADQLDPSDNTADIDNPAVTLKCLRLLVSTLQDPGIIKLNNTLLTLLEEFVTISVQSEIAAIRKEAILALSCCCLRSIESARQHMLLLLQAAHIDVHEVRIAAITAVVDLLMKHGLASFITADESPANNLDTSGGETGESSSVSPSKCGDGSIDNAMESDLATRGATLTQGELNAQGGNSVVAILTKILDEPDMELRTEVAEGLCKLLMIGAISSPKLLSRLLLIWYNPMTEADSKLRHILGTFFPLYCSMSKFHQRAMEDAFVPTMKILFDAPVTSPLAEIDIEDVGMFFVHLTREDMLQSFDKEKQTANILESSTTSIHDSLAVSVCNQVLSAPDGYQTKVLVKILTNLVLTHNNYVHLRELKVMSETLIKNIKEKSVIRSLEKFDKQLTDWLAKDPSGNEENQEDDVTRKTSVTDSGDENTDGSMTPTRSRKRILFSQSMSNTLLDPDQLPMKVSRSSSSSVYRSPTNKKYPSTDDEADEEDTTLIQEKNDVTTIPESDEDDQEIVSEITVDNAKNKKDGGNKGDKVGKKKNKEPEGGSLQSQKVSSIEILEMTTEEENDDDDFFSDASSVSGTTVKDLPKHSILDNSTDSETNDDTICQDLTPRNESRSKSRKEASSTETDTEEDTDDGKKTRRGRSKIPALMVKNKKPPTTPKNSATRGSTRGSTTSSPAPSSTRSSRSSRLVTPVSSPATVKKNSKTKLDKTPVSSPKTRSVVDVSSPRTLSRAGRNNSPRIDYKTGRKLDDAASTSSSSKSNTPVKTSTSTSPTKKDKAETGKPPKANVSKKTPKDPEPRQSTRKRNKVKTPESSRSSTNSSPVAKKEAVRKNLNNESSDEIVENTPPTTKTRQTRRAGQSSSSDTTSRLSRSKTTRK